MAPIGTVIKNGLIFAVLSAPLLWLASGFFADAILDLIWSMEGGSVATSGFDFASSTHEDAFDRGVLELLLGFALSIIGVGIIYMKALSDTVEEGMIEF